MGHLNSPPAPQNKTLWMKIKCGKRQSWCPVLLKNPGYPNTTKKNKSAPNSDMGNIIN